jgi:hypothetical protein
MMGDLEMALPLSEGGEERLKGMEGDGDTEVVVIS